MRTRKVKGKEKGYCASGDHWLPLTEEHWYFKGTGARHVYLARCKKHERIRSAAWHHERRASCSADTKPKASSHKRRR